MILTAGTAIYYTGDMANQSDFGVITKAEGDNASIKLDDGREMIIMSWSIKNEYNGSCATRFVTRRAYDAYRTEQLARLQASLGK